jgi:hypothetical protein
MDTLKLIQTQLPEAVVVALVRLVRLEIQTATVETVALVFPRLLQDQVLVEPEVVEVERVVLHRVERLLMGVEMAQVAAHQVLLDFLELLTQVEVEAVEEERRPLEVEDRAAPVL